MTQLSVYKRHRLRGGGGRKGVPKPLLEAHRRNVVRREDEHKRREEYNNAQWVRDIEGNAQANRDYIVDQHMYRRKHKLKPTAPTPLKKPAAKRVEYPHWYEGDRDEGPVDNWEEVPDDNGGEPWEDWQLDENGNPPVIRRRVAAQEQPGTRWMDGEGNIHDEATDAENIEVDANGEPVHEQDRGVWVEYTSAGNWL